MRLMLDNITCRSRWWHRLVRRPVVARSPTRPVRADRCISTSQRIDWPYTVYRIGNAAKRAGSLIGGCLPALASGHGNGTIRARGAISGTRAEPQDRLVGFLVR